SRRWIFACSTMTISLALLPEPSRSIYSEYTKAASHCSAAALRSCLCTWRGGQDSNLRTGFQPVNRLAGGPNRPLWHLPVCCCSASNALAEREGFEPPVRQSPTAVFKTAAFNHSAIAPTGVIVTCGAGAGNPCATSRRHSNLILIPGGQRERGAPVLGVECLLHLLALGVDLVHRRVDPRLHRAAVRPAAARLDARGEAFRT